MKLKTFFSLKNRAFQVTLVVLILVATNLLTGSLVYSKKENEYNELKDRIKTTIDQKIAIQDELDALKLICPTEE